MNSGKYGESATGILHQLNYSDILHPKLTKMNTKNSLMTIKIEVLAIYCACRARLCDFKTPIFIQNILY